MSLLGLESQEAVLTELSMQSYFYCVFFVLFLKIQYSVHWNSDDCYLSKERLKCWKCEAVFLVNGLSATKCYVMQVRQKNKASIKNIAQI